MFRSLKNTAKPSIDGTHRPTKIAAFSSPLNHKISEKIRERKAADNNSRSAVDNFFVIQFFGLIIYKSVDIAL